MTFSLPVKCLQVSLITVNSQLTGQVFCSECSFVLLGIHIGILQLDMSYKVLFSGMIYQFAICLETGGTRLE